MILELCLTLLLLGIFPSPQDILILLLIIQLIGQHLVMPGVYSHFIIEFRFLLKSKMCQSLLAFVLVLVFDIYFVFSSNEITYSAKKKRVLSKLSSNVWKEIENLCCTRDFWIIHCNYVYARATCHSNSIPKIFLGSNQFNP